MTLSVPRKLSEEELAKIDTFIRTVSPETTPWQPTESQAERDAEVPSRIKKLLLELLPLSVNDHLVSRYLKKLNESSNQNEIYYWLSAIKDFHTKFSDAANKGGKLYQVVFREAARLALETSIGFSTQAINDFSKLELFPNQEKLMQSTQELIASYKAKRVTINIREDEFRNISMEGDIIKQVLKKLPKPLVFRTRSDTAALKQSCALDAVSPLKPAKPLKPLKLQLSQ